MAKDSGSSFFTSVLSDEQLRERVMELEGKLKKQEDKVHAMKYMDVHSKLALHDYFSYISSLFPMA